MILSEVVSDGKLHFRLFRLCPLTGNMEAIVRGTPLISYQERSDCSTAYQAFVEVVKAEGKELVRSDGGLLVGDEIEAE